MSNVLTLVLGIMKLFFPYNFKLVLCQVEQDKREG